MSCAFAIIEQVRGRFISELLVNKNSALNLDEANASLEDRISFLKLQLVKAPTDRQRQKVGDQLFFTEQAR
jgi:hypothetical protein